MGMVSHVLVIDKSNNEEYYCRNFSFQNNDTVKNWNNFPYIESHPRLLVALIL